LTNNLNKNNKTWKNDGIFPSFFIKTIAITVKLWYTKRVERFLCLDIGDRRIGVAVSDPFNTYALPVETYNRKNLKTDLEKITRYFKDKCATALVCGLPVNFDGTPSIQTQKALFFIEKLKEILGAPVYTVDERCTTCEAEDILISQGKSREERKKFVDSLAATSILGGFLNDRNKNKK
jgi:putative Holliday junction resolvase